MIEHIKKFWCGVFHQGHIKRDCYMRVNWQCSTCHRWAIPVDPEVEKQVIDEAIRAKLWKEQDK